MSTRRIRLTPLRRHLAALLTITLSTAFVAVALLGGALMQQSTGETATSMLRGADLVATPAAGTEPGAPAPDLPGTTARWPQLQSMVPLESGDGTTWAKATVAPPSSVQPLQLSAGREPTARNEVVISQRLAENLHLRTGSTVRATPPRGVDADPSTLTVVGIAEEPSDLGLLPPTPTVFVTEHSQQALLHGPLEDFTTAWLYAGGSSSLPKAPAGWEVRSADAIRAEQQERSAQEFTPLSVVIGAFVTIALVTAAVVVGTIFMVTLAQRVRSLALLRAIGATGGQVARTVLGESLRVGLLGALAGVLLGHLMVQLALLGTWAAGWLKVIVPVPVSAMSVALPLITGVVLALAASLLPLRRAMAVRPLEAMRSAVPGAARLRPWRLAAAGIVLALGALLLVGGTILASRSQDTNSLVLFAAIAGGAISLFGVLFLLPFLVPALGGLLSLLVRPLRSLPARMAVANLRRTPGRTAATLAALLIGTSLMTMMAVGARTAQATLDQDLASRKPVDVVLRAPQLPADLLGAVRSVEGISQADQVPTAELELGAEDTMTVLATTPEQITALSARSGLAEQLEDGVLLTGAGRAERFGVRDGQVLSLPGHDGGTTTVRVVVDGNLDMSLMTPGTLSSLRPKASGAAVLARLAEPGSPQRKDKQAVAIVAEIQDKATASGAQDLSVSAEGAEREKYAQVLQILLGVTVGLLAVAVLVAVVGVASTLGLGVVERTGENALLRALGTTRGQMRAMLGWEGVLLGGLGAIGGIVLGTAYGLLGVQALLGGTSPVVPSLPVIQLIMVLVGSVLAGWVASVLPARRAARTAPARALAEN